MSSIWWIRRDLRLRDNLTLQRALENTPILPVFILDPLLYKNAPENRLDFLYRNLKSLDHDLTKRGSRLVVKTGKPVEILAQLMDETGVDRIYAEEDFTPYAQLRSILVGSRMPLKLIQGQLGLHPLEARKANDKPYRVFTPFKRNWLGIDPTIKLAPVQDKIPTIAGVDSEPIPNGKEAPLFPAGEEAAHQRLELFLRKKIEFYHLNRDRMDLDGTSNMSPYFHFGVVGLRTALHRGLKLCQDPKRKDVAGIQTWLSELLWREFYIHIMYHFPKSRTQNFRSLYDQLKWRNQHSEFQAWKMGQTGYPVVDAGMRQLMQTGWMHNRARMITASFLVKDLLVDWRWGEEWFRECLLDGDLAVNVGSWQWAAGTGTDAAPFFRIFNPVRQSKKFDPNGSYIRRWVPELAHLNNQSIHEPWKAREKSLDYPKRIVDHKFARERALNVFEDLRS